jgi:alpha-beta hydrolase superfamily lysophospholipase
MYNNSQHTFTSHDGTELFYQHWATATPSTTKKPLFSFTVAMNTRGVWRI